MTQIVVMSGKGGSGKTFVSSSLAAISLRSGNATVYADCDVDAANLHLMLDPTKTSCSDFVSGRTARVDPERCTSCGVCVERCRCRAITKGGATASSPAVVDPVACEGCGVCAWVCPERAIALAEQRRGRWCTSDTPYGTLVHARLDPGGENSGKLVERVRREAVGWATSRGAGRILIDGPPGTGCAAKSAMTGTDFVLIVAEPTPGGVHDMLRIVDLADHFRIPVGLIVNKADLSSRQTNELRRIAAAGLLAYLGEIPFSRRIPEALTELVPYPLRHDDAITATLRAAWNRIRHELERHGA